MTQPTTKCPKCGLEAETLLHRFCRHKECPIRDALKKRPPLAKAESRPMPTGRDTFTDEQIKHMVSRFLAWRLPENFSPDGGISFKPTFNDHMPFGPMKHEPTGTNLFDATQAEAMVRYMIEGMPLAASQQPTDAMVHAGAAALRAIFPALSFEEQADVVLRAALAKASGEPT